VNAFNQLREVLAALNYENDDLPLDQDLARLLRCACENEALANYIRRIQATPDLLDAFWDVGPDELVEELRSLRIPWTKVYRVLPQLAAAIAVLEKPS